MDTFGDRLKTEREDRGLTIQAVAEILRVDHDLFGLSERNDFDALPDEAAMRDCLHAYAECLQVEADLMIEDYDRERDKSLHRIEEIAVDQVAETAPPTIRLTRQADRDIRLGSLRWSSWQSRCSQPGGCCRETGPHRRRLRRWPPLRSNRRLPRRRRRQMSLRLPRRRWPRSPRPK